VVDTPALCSFIFPAIVDRSPLTVAISSSGASPVLARRIRSRIEAMLPAAIADIARFGRLHRERVSAPPAAMRTTAGASGKPSSTVPMAQLFLSNRWQEAEQALARLLDAHRTQDSTGEVYLIGAGPGDPELMTFKALRLLQRADVVLHDRLVNPGYRGHGAPRCDTLLRGQGTRCA
jgi:uroporphyrin-III C-methyltransferase/precorrin-2 dehydrogenase/sirohydrochlorin ferrochelatase